MSKQTKCPRCHGPATMVDKAPKGESGDVVRCDAEKTCVALHEAAREVEETHAAIVDAAAEFVRAVGQPKDRYADVTIPGYLYREISEPIREWKAAGQKLHDATVAHAAAVRP